MYLLSQLIIFSLIAAAIGFLIACLLGFCRCNKAELEAELETLRVERDSLLAAGGDGSSRRVAALEAELAEARVRADEMASSNAKLKGGGEDEDAAAMKWRNRYLEARVKFLEGQGSTVAPMAAGIAGAVVGAAAAKKTKKKSAEPKVEVAPKAEAAPKAAAKAAKKVEVKAEKPAPVDNTNFVPSPLAKVAPEALEAAVLAAGAGKAPPRSRKRANPDDLLLIDGVGPKNNAWLNDQGIYYFHQIATMNIEQVAWLSENLPTFGSRVFRENWVAQCTNLARGLPAKG
jgi:predicted flap endonuclease-1-like 5' DNA nuclease